MLQLIQMARKPHLSGPDHDAMAPTAPPETDFIPIPSGRFCMGSDDPHGYDNEKKAHEVQVGAFELARTPVTAADWRLFMADRGYSRRELWCAEGWAWRSQERAERPEYWLDHETYAGPVGTRVLDPKEPVSCVSWFEADAYARWAGARLPTEQEWEYAARGPQSMHYPWGIEPPEGRACSGMTNWGPVKVGSHSAGASPFGILDMAGNVWEWTSTPFLPYPGFEAFPYEGYSLDHMKGAHKVCRGGSWATSERILRCSFRNWYVPTYRQGFLGVRLAR
jgi:iron(II)-dependent oxidoreductase